MSLASAYDDAVIHAMTLSHGVVLGWYDSVVLGWYDSLGTTHLSLGLAGVQPLSHPSHELATMTLS